MPRSKTSLMDPRFAPAWVAFGHTFALEGEHDHAVTAYSTCARMFTGYVYLDLPVSARSINQITLRKIASTPYVRRHGAHNAVQLCPRG